ARCEILQVIILLALGVLAVIPGVFLLIASGRRFESLVAVSLLVAFHIVSCSAFAITPYSIFHHDLSSSVWFLRLGMPLFVSAVLIYSLTATHLCTLMSAPRIQRRVGLASVLLTVTLMVGLPLYWSRAQPTGLPGYEQVKGLPHTDVYSWVQSQASPLRIYSAGLLPYGLYGPHWRNKLFYDLHSDHLSQLQSAKARVSAIV